MQLERDQDYRSGGMRGPHPHADRDTAKDSSSKFHGVGERKKQPDAVREVPGAKIEIPEPGILVPWVLCGHGREKCKEDTGVYPMSVRAGQSRRAGCIHVVCPRKENWRSGIGKAGHCDMLPL